MTDIFWCNRCRKYVKLTTGGLFVQSLRCSRCYSTDIRKSAPEDSPGNVPARRRTLLENLFGDL